MTEKEDIKGEASRALARIERAGRKEQSKSHVYLRTVAEGRFSLLNPKRTNARRT